MGRFMLGSTVVLLSLITRWHLIPHGLQQSPYAWEKPWEVVHKAMPPLTR
jgi:hypothetical protein